jgi:hypothetical protein
MRRYSRLKLRGAVVADGEADAGDVARLGEEPLPTVP